MRTWPRPASSTFCALLVTIMQNETLNTVSEPQLSDIAVTVIGWARGVDTRLFEHQAEWDLYRAVLSVGMTRRDIEELNAIGAKCVEENGKARYAHCG